MQENTFFQRIPGGLALEAETLDTVEPTCSARSGACERFRKATLEDFLEDGETINQNNKHNKNHKHNNDNDIKKNQQEFGHKKRIKP